MGSVPAAARSSNTARRGHTIRSIRHGSSPGERPLAPPSCRAAASSTTARSVPGYARRKLAATPSADAGSAHPQVTGELEGHPTPHAVGGDGQPLGHHRVERIGEHHVGKAGHQDVGPAGRVEMQSGCPACVAHGRRPYSRGATPDRGPRARPGATGSHRQRLPGATMEPTSRRRDAHFQEVLVGFLTAASSGAGGGIVFLAFIFFYILFALPVWGTYQKASPQGDPAWAAFVPIYNFIVLLRVAGRPKTWAWFLLLPLVPYLGSLALLVISIFILNDVSKSFGHGRRVHRRPGPAARHLLVHPVAGQEHLPRPEGPRRHGRQLRARARLPGTGRLRAPAAARRLPTAAGVSAAAGLPAAAPARYGLPASPRSHAAPASPRRHAPSSAATSDGSPGTTGDPPGLTVASGPSATRG